MLDSLIQIDEFIFDTISFSFLEVFLPWCYLFYRSPDIEKSISDQKKQGKTKRYVQYALLIFL